MSLVERAASHATVCGIAEQSPRRRVHQQHASGNVDDGDRFVQTLEQRVEVRHLTGGFLELLLRPQAGQEQSLVRLAQVIAGGALAGQHQLGGIVDADEQSFRMAFSTE